MDPLRRAYVELMMALAGLRAAKDVQRQVVFWRSTGEAAQGDVLDAGERVKMASDLYSRSVRTYSKLAGMSPSVVRRLG